jgi:hypothetical protein
MQQRVKWHVLEALSLAVGAYVSVTGANGFRKDELVCEEALARLEDCCGPAHFARVSCSYDKGCMSNPTYPLIGPEESVCIREATCQDLHARGVCERVAEGGWSSGDEYADLRGCP